MMTMLHYSVVLTPVIAFGALRKSKNICFASVFVLIVGMLQSAILHLPSIGVLAQLKFNWLQKAAAFVLTILLIRSWFFRGYDFGLCLPNKRQVYFAFGMAILIGLAFALIDSLSAMESQTLQAAEFVEFILFEMSMPGLQEEPFYRGFILGVLDKNLGYPWRVLGVQLGWGCVISTILFSVGHTIALDKDWHLVINPDIGEWINMVVFSLFMCWLRYRSGSFWTAVLAHNIDNAVSQLVSQLIIHR